MQDGPLRIEDFVAQTDGVSLEDLPPAARDRLNAALADLTDGSGDTEGISQRDTDGILVSTDLADREGFETITDALVGENLRNAGDESGSPPSAGATLLVEPGTYTGDSSDQITIETPGLTLLGREGPAETTVESQVIVEADDVTVSGLSVSPPDPGDTGGADEAIRVDNGANGVTIVDNVVEDFARNTGDDKYVGVDGINIFGGDGDDPVDNVTVRNNVVQRLQNPGDTDTNPPGGVAGISVQGNVQNSTVVDNTVKKIGQETTSYGFGIVVRGTGNNSQTPTGVKIKNNDIDNVLSDSDSEAVGVGIGLEAGEAGDVTFTGNEISNTEFLLEDKTATIDLNSFVDNNTLNRGALLEDGDFEGAPGNAPVRNVIFDSIQLALDFATQNSTIEVVSGTYQEELTIDVPGVELVCQGDTPTIQPSQDLNFGDRANIIEIAADDVTLENIGVDGDNPSLSPTINAPLGVYLNQAVGATVRDCTIRNTNAADSSTTIGVWAPPNSAVTVEDSTFENHQTGVFVRGQVNVRNSTFTDVARGVNTNNINGSTTVNGIEYGEVVGNTINATSIGIRLNNHYKNDNGSDGPSQSGTPVYNVENNTVSGATEGINVLSISNKADVDLKNNDVSDCVRGYDLTNLTTTETIRIEGGTVTNCETGLIAFSDNEAFSGAQHGGRVGELAIGSDVTFQSNTNVDIRAYGADVKVAYEGTSASASAENGAVIN
ncbi:hypothetical protein [Halorubrum sp. ASP1]|uniref:hypothetical protein n=1 Tax=Halorubrum sp. ASP1 TaxID=2518114 RepID=UPI0013051819|nr:hypothetical protein [Halorubrum sp. ASP1]